MSHRLKYAQLAALLCALCAVPSSAYALGIDIPRPKKDKKKKEKKDDAKAEEKPEAKPEAKAEEKPEAKDSGQADSAATAPAATVHAGGVTEIKMPKSSWDKMKDMVKAGDWVEYEYAGGMKTRVEIVEAGDHFYTQKSKTQMMGQATEQTVKMIFSEPDPKVEAAQNPDEKIETREFADKIKIPNKGEVSATRYENYRNGKLIAKSWMSKEVPAGGMVRSETPEGQAMMQLVDYGRK